MREGLGMNLELQWMSYHRYWYSWKFSPGENSCPALIGKMFHPTDILFYVNDYIQPMAIFTAWAKCIPLNIPKTQG